MRSVRRGVLAAAFLGVFVAPVAARADDDELSDEEQLREIDRQVSAEAERLSGIREAQDLVKAELKKLQSELAALKKKGEELAKELDTIRTEAAKAESDRKAAEERAELLAQRAQTRLAALYTHRAESAGELASVFVRMESGTFARNVFFISKVREHDRALVLELAAVKAERETRVRELAELADRRESVRSGIAEQAKRVKERHARRSELAKNLRDQELAAETALAELRAQALRLEAVVSSLTLDGDERREAEPEADPEFLGRGLAREGQRLEAPIVGAIVRRFGQGKRADFNDLVFTKGLEFRTAGTSDVKAVEGGRVLYVGAMPGYGTIVILDHGRRYYSLYGRLGDTQVEGGRTVRRGEVIAEAGDAPPSSSGGNFYFEIRHNGEAIDPAPFLSAAARS